MDYDSQTPLFPSLGNTPSAHPQILVPETDDSEDSVDQNTPDSCLSYESDEDNTQCRFGIVEDEEVQQTFPVTPLLDTYPDEMMPESPMRISNYTGLPIVTNAWQRWFVCKLRIAISAFDQCDLPDFSSVAVALSFMGRCRWGSLSMELRATADVLTNLMLMHGIHIHKLVDTSHVNVPSPPADFDWNRSVHKQFMRQFAFLALAPFTTSATRVTRSRSGRGLPASDAGVEFVDGQFVFSPEQEVKLAQTVNERVMQLHTTRQPDMENLDNLSMILYLHMRRMLWDVKQPDKPLVVALVAWFTLVSAFCVGDPITAEVVRHTGPLSDDTVACKQQINDYIDNALFVCLPLTFSL